MIRLLTTYALHAAAFLFLASIGYSRTEVVEEAEGEDVFAKWKDVGCA